jgi:hypothetical protein
MRDLAKWWNRRGVDPESGMNHLAHVATNAVFLLRDLSELQVNGNSREDCRVE